MSRYEQGTGDAVSPGSKGFPAHGTLSRMEAGITDTDLR